MVGQNRCACLICLRQGADIIKTGVNSLTKEIRSMDPKGKVEKGERVGEQEKKG